jgi:hypothetical protein
MGARRDEAGRKAREKQDEDTVSGHAKREPNTAVTYIRQRTVGFQQQINQAIRDGHRMAPIGRPNVLVCPVCDWWREGSDYTNADWSNHLSVINGTLKLTPREETVQVGLLTYKVRSCSQPDAHPSHEWELVGPNEMFHCRGYGEVTTEPDPTRPECLCMDLDRHKAHVWEGARTGRQYQCPGAPFRTPAEAKKDREVDLDEVTLPAAKGSKSSAVVHPAHYNSGKFEVIRVIEDWKLGFHLGNAVKYIARAGKKDPAKEVEDIDKAIFYLEQYKQHVLGGKK